MEVKAKELPDSFRLRRSSMFNDLYDVESCETSFGATPWMVVARGLTREQAVAEAWSRRRSLERIIDDRMIIERRMWYENALREMYQSKAEHIAANPTFWLIEERQAAADYLKGKRYEYPVIH